MQPTGARHRTSPLARRRFAQAAAATGALLLWLGAASAPARPGVRLRVGAPATLPPGSRVLAPLSPARRLRLTVALEPQDPAALKRAAAAIADPASPLFRRYLSPAAFAERFGASPAEFDSVRSALRAAGLEVDDPPANHLALPVEGPVQQIERALSVSLVEVRLANGRTGYANVRAPTLPSDAARNVVAVAGLENVSARHARSPDRGTGTRSPPAGRPRPVQPSAAASRVRPEAPRRARVPPKLQTGGPQPCEKALSRAGKPPRASTRAIRPTRSPARMDSRASTRAATSAPGRPCALLELEGYDPADLAPTRPATGLARP